MPVDESFSRSDMILPFKLYTIVNDHQSAHELCNSFVPEDNIHKRWNENQNKVIKTSQTTLAVMTGAQ